MVGAAMFCESCRRERGFSRFCILCGSALVRRATPLIETDLDRVRWLIGEVASWDESLAPPTLRAAISEYYGRQEQVLLSSLSAALQPEMEPPTPTGTELTHAPPASPVEVAVPPVEADVPSPGPGLSPELVLPPPVVEPAPPAPVVARPSRWKLTWKPILHESLGWFLGAFLILSGVLYLVADAWGGMTSTSRALTVFGLVEGWALGFFAWAAALSRRERTQPASRGLRRIAALVSPLAVLTLGPSLDSAWSWAALALGTGLSGFLSRRAARDVDAPGAALLSLSTALATASLGLVPVLPPSGAWLVLLPAALAVAAVWRGEAASLRSLGVFALPAAASAARFLVSPAHADLALAPACVAVAALAAAALELRAPEGRGALRVVASSLLLVSFAASFATAAPACVVIAALGALATARQASRGGGAWWLAGTYAFASLSWQRLDQLVPAIVWSWWGALKAALGYAAAPMPASYASVYQALFVAAGALVAGWRVVRSGQTPARHVWLRCSALAGAAAGALALVGVQHDARPALVTLPLLALPLLGAGLAARRLDALAAGSALAVAFSAVLGLSMPIAGAAVAGALALAAHALVPGGLAARARVILARNTAPVVVSRRAARWERWLVAGAGLVAGALALLSSLSSSEGSAVSTVAALGCVLSARALGRRHAMLGWLLALVPLLHLGALFTSSAALTGAVLWRLQPRKWPGLVPALVTAALVAPLASLVDPHGPGALTAPPAALAALLAAAALTLVPWRGWPLLSVAVVLGGAAVLPSAPVAFAAGVPWLLAAAALGVLLRAHALLWAPAVAALVVGVLPGLGPWTAWGAPGTLLACGALALGASVHASRRGRSWQAAWAASVALLGALATLLHGGDAERVACAALALTATPALLGAVTVPLAAALFAVAGLPSPLALLAVAAGAAALAQLDRLDWAWVHLLGGRSVAWSGTVCSALALGVALWLEVDSLAVTLAAVLLPLAWARATRRAEWLAAGVALLTCTPAWWLAPVLSLAGGRLLLGEHAVLRARLGLDASSDLEELLSLVLTAAVAGVAVAAEPAHGPLWGLALGLRGGPGAALRLAGAVALAAPFEPARAPLLGVLVGLGAATRHARAQVQRLLGARALEFVEPLSLFGAVAGAVLLAVAPAPPVTPAAWPALAAFGGGLAAARWWTGRRRALALLVAALLALCLALLPASLALPSTLAAAGVLLGLPALIAAAPVSLLVDLPATVQQGLPVLVREALAVVLLAAGAALALRGRAVEARAGAAWRWLGRQPEGALSAPPWWAAFAGAALLVAQRELSVLFVVPLLLVTPWALEAGAALGLAAVAAWLLLPAGAAVAALCPLALGAAVASRRLERLPAAAAWRHGAWLLALGAIARAGVDLHSTLVPLAWASAAATTWALARASRRAEGVAWAVTALALHVSLAVVGVRASTGAPEALILPWWGAASAGLALARHLRGGARSTLAFAGLSLFELVLGCGLLASAQPREALVSIAVASALAFVAWRRVVAQDHGGSAWLGQGAVLAGALAARVLGAGAMPGLTESWVLLGASAFFAGLARLLAREGRPSAAAALRRGALLWPALGALLVPWTSWSLGATWLLGLSVLSAWLARAGSRGPGAVLSALALNAAVALAACGSGFGALQLLLAPLGLSLLALGRVFQAELPEAALVRVRAWGMGLVYAAVAWAPLTATSVPALALCVLVCLGGVALGAAWRIRSYVALGTGVLVTAVLATLVRSGLAEPRLGAVLLSALGLAVVAVMVVLSTRRAEVQERLAALQRVMASWEA